MEIKEWSGASVLVMALARRITERGERPVLNAQVYGGVLKTTVGCMERAALKKGRSSDAAA
ncbi:MAG TPA: hypothetical protein VNJ03_13270 [Vicinamibacterales bacterium]|nr:hypothetical protein [Vicinamibacterales bacterium]